MMNGQIDKLYLHDADIVKFSNLHRPIPIQWLKNIGENF